MHAMLLLRVQQFHISKADFSTKLLDWISEKHRILKSLLKGTVIEHVFFETAASMWISQVLKTEFPYQFCD